jgi:hypothetical protein
MRAVRVPNARRFEVMNTKPEIGSVWIGWDKRWRVESVKNGTARIVNVGRPENWQQIPLTQFRGLVAVREP